MDLQQVPGDLLNYMDVHYKAEEPEMDSKNLQIDYEGTEFDEPEILPDIAQKNWCNGEENGNGGNGNSDNGNGDTNGNLLLKAAILEDSSEFVLRESFKLYQTRRNNY